MSDANIPGSSSQVPPAAPEAKPAPVPQNRGFEGCVICLEEINLKGNDIVVTPCIHQFHRKCLKDWMLIGNPHCPLCQTYVSPGVVLPELYQKPADEDRGNRVHVVAGLEVPMMSNTFAWRATKKQRELRRRIIRTHIPNASLFNRFCRTTAKDEIMSENEEAYHHLAPGLEKIRKRAGGATKNGQLPKPGEIAAASGNGVMLYPSTNGGQGANGLTLKRSSEEPQPGPSCSKIMKLSAQAGPSVQHLGNTPSKPKIRGVAVEKLVDQLSSGKLVSKWKKSAEAREKEPTVQENRMRRFQRRLRHIYEELTFTDVPRSAAPHSLLSRFAEEFGTRVVYQDAEGVVGGYVLDENYFRGEQEGETMGHEEELVGHVYFANGFGEDPLAPNGYGEDPLAPHGYGEDPLAPNGDAASPVSEPDNQTE